MPNYDDFSKAPQSITELKSDRLEDGSIATPRDALIGLLRAIDKGEITPERIFICYREIAKDGKAHITGQRRGGGGGWQEDLALLEGARQDIWEWARLKGV